MPEIICATCSKRISFDSPEPLAECPFCFERLTREVAGLTLVYQMNQQRIDVPAVERTVLGRRSFGAHVLSKIYFNGAQVVSRNHCSIELRNNQFYLRDEGSLNGTFYGPGKVDCRDAPQLIEDGSLLYLGEEPFVALVRYREPQQPPTTEQVAPSASPVAIKTYKCRLGCGYETQDPTSLDCPTCDAANSLVERN